MEGVVFQQFDKQFFEPFAGNPAEFLTKLSEFQRANFEAARQITENNVQAFQELAAIRDPQTLVTSQQAILQAAIQKNLDVMTGVWQAFGVQTPATGKKK